MLGTRQLWRSRVAVPERRPVVAPGLPVVVPILAAAGVAAILGIIVATTPIGSGDYGQWLMVSRAFGGETFPAYRSLADVPPIVPLLIASATALVDNPVLALHVVGLTIVLALGIGFYVAGWAVNGRPLAGLMAVVIGLLATDRFLELLAFGGLPQAVAVAFLMLAVAAFGRGAASPATQAHWWTAGCLALFATCLSHVPTATIGLPTCAAIAVVGMRWRGPAVVARLRALVLPALGFAAIGAYWLLVITPASADFVTNPASLAYRGPERVIDVLASYPPTVVVMAIGGLWLAAWLVSLGRRRTLPVRGDGRIALLAWLAASWAAYAWAASTGASTDYPRFVPLLVAPFVVAAAAGLASGAEALAARTRRPANGERSLVIIGLAVVVIAPFSIARYQTEAHGYELPDAASLTAAATWADERLVPGTTILAPVREAKWIEGLTGRAALFSTDVRYAFRPIEWERTLAAGALLRGNLALANESFVLTLTDGVASGGGTDASLQQPRSLLIGANHGGEFVELLRLVPASSRIVDAAGQTVASLPALEPAGFDYAATASLLTASTAWQGERNGAPVTYRQAIELTAGSSTFGLDIESETTLPATRLEVELRTPSGVALVDVTPSASTAEPGSEGASAVLRFARLGRSEPMLRITLAGDGTIAALPAGGVQIAAPGPNLRIQVTALTPGGASTSLRLLDPEELLETYEVGAAVLRRDTSYDARRARLELLGFHVARAEGPYIVMVRTGAARPADQP